MENRQTKICPKCGLDKPVGEFYADKSKKDGLQSSCKACRYAIQKSYREANKRSVGQSKAKYRLNNKDRIAARDKAYRENNKAKVLETKKAYREANKASIERYNLEYYEANKELLKQKSSDYLKANPEKNRAKAAKRKAAKLQRTPSWAEVDSINDFYIACPEGYHIDHIIPLCGKAVSGLHVLANLRYLPAEDNLRKSNKELFDPTTGCADCGK